MSKCADVQMAGIRTRKDVQMSRCADMQMFKLVIR